VVARCYQIAAPSAHVSEELEKTVQKIMMKWSDTCAQKDSPDVPMDIDIISAGRNGAGVWLERGTQSHFRFSGGMDLHGIDISSKELDKNRDVQHKILGDRTTHYRQGKTNPLHLCLVLPSTSGRVSPKQ